MHARILLADLEVLANLLVEVFRTYSVYLLPTHYHLFMNSNAKFQIITLVSSCGLKQFESDFTRKHVEDSLKTSVNFNYGFFFNIYMENDAFEILTIGNE